MSQNSWYNDNRASALLEIRRVASYQHYVSDTDRNVLILHSSGTTGLPKPISQSHRFLLNFAPLSSFDTDYPDFPFSEQKIAFSTLPLYHVFGLMAPMLSLSIGKPFAIPPSGFIPTAASTVEFLSSANASTLFVVPSILEDIAELPENRGIEALQSLQYVACGGGALNNAIGEKLVASGVKLINGFGGTEVGSMGILQPPGPDRDWKYFRLRRDLQCNIKEVAHSKSRESTRYRISIRPSGWTEDFEISDHFVTSHKRVGQDFRPIERVDDVLVLKTGEKVQPYTLETMLSDRTDIRAALAFGNGQFEIGVMIEPSRSVASHEIEQFKDAVWSTIVEAGDKMDAHARVSSRELVVVLNPGQAFPRSAKGSVLRKAAYEEFHDEIIAAYAKLENLGSVGIKRKPIQVNGTKSSSTTAALEIDTTNTGRTTGCKTMPASQTEIDIMVTDVVENLWQPGKKSELKSSRQTSSSLLNGNIEENLLEYIRLHIWKPHSQPLNTTDDLFELGMDSLQAVQIQRFLLSEVSQSKDQLSAPIEIPKDFLYTHSSIAQITSYLQGSARPSSAVDTSSSTLEKLLTQYVPSEQPKNIQTHTTGGTVVLTGGTGALGCHLLAQLASSTTIDRIICLNRPGRSKSNPYARQFASIKEKGAGIPLSMIDKVEVLETNTALPNLGLTLPVYWAIASAVTHIIHNAWPVDFKRTVASFESQFKIMQNLINFARDSSCSPRFMFVSSIAVVAQYTNPQIKKHDAIIVPEQPFQPHWPTPTMGYGQAKLVCEKMLERAANENIVDGVIVRCAQISGSTSNGYWNASEYFPTLLRNSHRVGALPELEGVSYYPHLRPLLQ